MKTRLGILAISMALTMAACDTTQMSRYVDVTPAAPATQPTAAPKAPAMAAAPKVAPVAPKQADVAKPMAQAAPVQATPVQAAAPAAPKPAAAVAAMAANDKPKVRQTNADANDLPDPYPASYTLPSGEVLTVENVQNPLPADGKLSNLAGIHMTLTDLPEKAKLATFAWEESKTKVPTTRRVILTQDTVVDFNGKLGTINDIDPQTARGAVVAYVSKNGVYAVMLRFGHGLLQISSDDLNAKQVAGLESISPMPSGASNESYEKRAASIASNLKLDDKAKEAAVDKIILTQQESVRNAHNAGFAPPKTVRATFNKDLAAVLTPEQIDAVKNALTFDKTPNTFRVFNLIVPGLNSDDQKVIMAFLMQAREESLDIKNVKDMADVYKPYKTQVENYLNAHGHDYTALRKKFLADPKNAGAAGD